MPSPRAAALPPRPRTGLGRYSFRPEAAVRDIETSAPAGPLSPTDKIDLTIFGLFYFVVLLFNGFIGSYYLGEQKGFWVTRSFYLVGGLSVGLSLLRGKWRGPLSATLLFSFFLFLMFQFADISGDDLGLRPLYGQLEIFIIPSVVLLMERGRYREIEKILYILTAGYALWYFAMSLGVMRGIVHQTDSAIFAAGAKDTRGVRLHMDDTAMSLLFFMSWFRIKNIKIARPLDWAVFLICVADLYLSKSRVYEACLLYVVLMLLVFRDTTRVSWAAAGLFLAVSTYLILGLTHPGNPFAIFGGDVSATARGTSYEIAKPIIAAHWLSGVGLAATLLGDKSITLVTQFYWDDLGPVGILYVGGLFGMFVFGGMSLCCFMGYNLLRKSGAPKTFSSIFGLAAVATALYGIISPALWGNGVFMFAIIFSTFVAKSPGGPASLPLRPQSKVRRVVQHEKIKRRWA
jgi:hypothetical protein